ncbi:hypothetical protein [Shimazuella alba]
MIDRIVERFGTINLLVNNAHITEHVPFDNLHRSS